MAKETRCRTDGYTGTSRTSCVDDPGDARLFHLITYGLDDPHGGEGDVSPHLRPIESLWRRIPMATAILNTQKARSKAARPENKAVLRKRQIQRAAGLLKHVSDPTRLQVISLLAERERHVGGLCEEFNMSQPAMSHHLALLRLGGLIQRRRQGKNNFYSLTDSGERLSNIVKGVAR